MKVICKENRAINLNLKEVKVLLSNEASFPIKKGEKYIVLGSIVYRDSNYIYYLLSDYGDWPFWMPYQLFNILDSDILPDWCVKIFDRKHYSTELFFLSGFYELCNNENFYDALIEREEWALDIYFKRQREAKEWYELKPFMTRSISL